MDTGIKKQLKQLWTPGVARVIIGSRAIQDMDFAKECLEEFGEHIILSADAKSFTPQVHGWEKETELDLIGILKNFVSFGAKEIIYTDIHKDGTLEGPSLDNIEKILTEVHVRIIAAGGVTNIEDIKKLKGLQSKGLIGAIVGRALYEGTIDLVEAIDVGKTYNPMS